jgi:hypothetical protein
MSAVPIGRIARLQPAKTCNGQGKISRCVGERRGHDAAARELHRQHRLQPGMTDEIIIGTFDSRGEAEAARDRLLAEGVAADAIHVECGPSAGEAPMPPGDRFAMHEVDEPPPAERGFAEVVSRMFSGALMDDANDEPYMDALRGGRCLLAVRYSSEHERRVAAAVLAPSTPQTYSLPNAPSGWNQASANDPPSIGGVDHDPARPQGLLSDAEGISAHADVDRLSQPGARGRR